MSMGSTIALIKALAPVADPAVVAEAVEDWLDEHPTAVTPIDDTAGEGDTDKLWSAGKTATETEALKEAIVDKADIKTSSKTGVDLDVSDTNGNVILRLAGGGIETKNFKSNLIRQLTGKKWTVIGDSLTEVNLRTTMHYHDYIAEETGITVVNLGRSGRGYAKENDGINYSGVVSSIPQDTDVITIFGSGNDTSAELDLGTPTDTGSTTICGCINATFDAIYASFPTTPLGVITPTPWINKEPSDGETNLSLYCEALVEICALRGIPCLDLFHCSLLHPDDSSFRALAYSKDEGNGVHPDETGHKMIAPRFRQFLFSII